MNINEHKNLLLELREILEISKRNYTQRVGEIEIELTKMINEIMDFDVFLKMSYYDVDIRKKSFNSKLCISKYEYNDYIDLKLSIESNSQMKIKDDNNLDYYLMCSKFINELKKESELYHFLIKSFKELEILYEKQMLFLSNCSKKEKEISDKNTEIRVDVLSRNLKKGDILKRKGSSDTITIEKITEKSFFYKITETTYSRRYRRSTRNDSDKMRRKNKEDFYKMLENKDYDIEKFDRVFKLQTVLNE